MESAQKKAQAFMYGLGQTGMDTMNGLVGSDYMLSPEAQKMLEENELANELANVIALEGMAMPGRAAGAAIGMLGGPVGGLIGGSVGGGITSGIASYYNKLGQLMRENPELGDGFNKDALLTAIGDGLLGLIPFGHIMDNARIPAKAVAKGAANVGTGMLNNAYSDDYVDALNNLQWWR